MKTCWMATAALLSVIVPARVAADPPKPDQCGALEKKLVGAWIGQSPCGGNLVFQADGTYHYSGFGPGGGTYEVGTWKVEWNELPPTLVMLESPADPADAPEVRKVHLVRLSDKQLDFRHMAPYSPRVEKHRRGTEADDVAIRLYALDSAVQQYLGRNNLGGGVTLPAHLKTLVDTRIVRPESLLDPWGKEFRYDPPGRRNKGERPDIWTETPGKKDVIGNWPKSESRDAVPRDE